MNESLEKSYQRQRETIHELLETGRFNQIRSLLNVLRPADVAVLLESSPPKERRIVWNLFSESDQSEILHEIDEDFIEGLLADKSAEELFPVNKSGGRPPKARERFSGVNTFDVSP